MSNRKIDKEAEKFAKRTAKLRGIKFTVNKEAKVEPCPECGNETEFRAKSRQVAEDHCNVWVRCGKCGFDPTEERTLHRYEDVWGGVNKYTISSALMVWNDVIIEFYKEDNNE